VEGAPQVAVCEWDEGGYGRLLQNNGEGGGLNCKDVGPLFLGYYSSIVLSVGCNDPCDASRTPASVVRDLLDLSQHLVSAFGCRICQVI